MTVLRFGLTPKMKPVSPRRTAVVAGLDIGTSKIACMIARLEPQAPQDVLRRRSHGVRILGIAHTAAGGMKAGGVVDLIEVEEMVRQAIDIAESMAKVRLIPWWWRCPADVSAASASPPTSNFPAAR